jgi:tetratricopeptide (TPR) repeat protein
MMISLRLHTQILLHCFLWSWLTWYSQLAHAQNATITPETEKQAIEFYQKGVVFYNEENYSLALQAFETSYALSGKKELLYNCAITLEKMQKYPEAIEKIQEFRLYAPLDWQEKLRTDEARIQEKAQQQERENAQIELQQQEREEQEKLQQQLQLQQQKAQAQVVEAKIKKAHIRKKQQMCMVIGGAITTFSAMSTGITYRKGQVYREDIDKESYNQIQPYNHASLVGVGLGVLATGGCFLLPSVLSSKEIEKSDVPSNANDEKR